MKNISNKKLFISSAISVVAGVTLVLLNAWQVRRTSSIDHVNELHFYRTYIWPIGIVLFLLGLMTLVFAVGRILARNLTRLLIISVGLLLIGDWFIWLCKQKLALAEILHNGAWVDYRYTYLPIAVFVFALGAVGTITALSYFLLAKSRKVQAADEHDN